MFYNVAGNDYYQDSDTTDYEDGGDDYVCYNDDYEEDDNDNDANAFVDSDFRKIMLVPKY